jgi:GntR family transcriptional regulator
MPEIHQVPAKYQQIADHIRARIFRGELKPGDEVPSERTLVTDWDVARPTAAKALATLRRQGFVETRQGSGTYVSGYQQGSAGGRPFRTGSIDVTFASDASIEFLVAEATTGPAHVVQELGQPTDATVIRRTILVNNKDATPAELLTSWFPLELAKEAPLLLEPELAPNGVRAYLATATGRRAARGRDKVIARLATENERCQLRLADPSAVLVHCLTVFDSEGAALLFNEAVYPPDSWRSEQEFPFPS